MIPYLLHASILIMACYIFYWLLIRRETFFELNRWVLIGTLILSITIPLIVIPSQWSLVKHSYPQSLERSDNTSSVENVMGNNDDIAPTTSPNTNAITQEIIDSNNKSLGNAPINNNLIWIIYFIGVAVFTIAFLVQLIMLLSKMHILESVQDGPYRIVELNKEEAPYSFWNAIYINPSSYDEITYNQIIAHEKVHIDQAHFIDKLLVELVLIFFWFNPFVWLYRISISNNLEFLTDYSMLTQGVEKTTYQYSLLQVSVPQHALNLSTNYNQSFLKNRIEMMNIKKSSARSTWKYLFVLPLLAFSMITLNAVHFDSTTALSDMLNEDVNLSEAEIKERKELKERLLEYLSQDGLIANKEETILVELLEAKIFVNKKALSNELDGKYRDLLLEYKFSADKDQVYVVEPVVVFSGAMINENHEYSIQFKNSNNTITANEISLKEDFLLDLEDNNTYDKLLSNSKTKLSNRHKSNESIYWRWPSFQNELLELLQKESFTTDTKKLQFVITDEEIIINGSKISNRNYKKYKDLFNEFDIPFESDWRYFKKGEHIVVMDPNLEPTEIRKEFLQQLKANGLIKSLKSEVKLDISGHRILLNNNDLADKNLSTMYQLLNDYSITPVPGKIIHINGDDDVLIHIGYKLDQTYIGTMEFK